MKTSKKQISKLIENGQYVMAYIIDVDINEHLIIKKNSVSIHPYHIIAQYVGIDGSTYVFKSDKYLYNPAGLLQGRNVKVYVDLNKPDKYWMDFSNLLPQNVELHKFKLGIGSPALKQMGQYIMAETCGVELLGYTIKGGVSNSGAWILDKDIVKADIHNRPVDYKGRKYLGFLVLCRYVAPDGVTHIFASRGRFGSPQNTFIGQQIMVFYQGNDFSQYYVDSDRITELSR